MLHVPKVRYSDEYTEMNKERDGGEIEIGKGKEEGRAKSKLHLVENKEEETRQRWDR